jgi:hypothetical protein
MLSLSHRVPSICITPLPSVSLEFEFIIINVSLDESACGRWVQRKGRTGINMEKISHDNTQYKTLTFFFGFSGHFDSRWKVMM